MLSMISIPVAALAVGLPAQRAIAQRFSAMCRFSDAGMTDHPRAVAAGVRKAPRHEIAGNVALTVPRALWGFRHESWRVELRLKRLLRSVLRQS